ncbi:MAG TPA: GNAT family N-acetyltransferase [Reyranella sp.]|nr:GNAT family N-acetyltransferase [Reyranella sp.]
MSAEPSLTFVVAEPAQLDEVRRLMRTAFTPYIRQLGRELAADAYGWFSEAIANGDIFIALDGGAMVGAIATRRHESESDLELTMIGVSPARQKSGIASFMIGRIAEIARARGVRTLSLNTAEMMEDRVRLYSRHGFSIVRRGLPDHGMDSHVRVNMERRL